MAILKSGTTIDNTNVMNAVAAKATAATTITASNGISLNGGSSTTLGALTTIAITRTTTISTSDPSGGTDGDLWYKY